MKKFVSDLLKSSLAGISTLGLTYALSLFLGFSIKINAITMCMACLLGAPGVALLLIIRDVCV